MIRRFVRRNLLAFVAILLVFPTASVYSWGDEGHQIIGIIAYTRLTPAVKKKVETLLAADKDNLTAADFVSRATWADKYRDSDRSTTKIRYNATRNWHFVDIEITNGDTDSPCNHHPKLAPGTAASAGPAQGCLLDKIEQFADELRSFATPEPEKILALKFLLHLVGDLHQPLHVADNNDRGGNDVSVLLSDGTQTDNLHSYWDNPLVQRLGNNPQTIGEALGKQITKAKADAWSKGTVTDWAKESFRQAKSVAYNFTGVQQFTGDHGARGVHLNAVYDNRALPAVREQLSKSGVRLAAVLNNALK